MTGTDDEFLDHPSRSDGGDLAIDRSRALELTRARLDSSLTVRDDEIWEAWQRLQGGGPTVGDDLGRVVAELEGIAVDG